MVSIAVREVCLDPLTCNRICCHCLMDLRYQLLKVRKRTEVKAVMIYIGLYAGSRLSHNACWAAVRYALSRRFGKAGVPIIWFACRQDDVLQAAYSRQGTSIQLTLVARRYNFSCASRTAWTAAYLKDPCRDSGFYRLWDLIQGLGSCTLSQL